MANIAKSYAEYRIRRSADGVLAITVRHSPELQLSFKAAAHGRKNLHPTTGIELWEVPTPSIRDWDLAGPMFAVGADKAEIRATVSLPRTREQIQRTAEAIRMTLKEWYAKYLNPVDVRVVVQREGQGVPV